MAGAMRKVALYLGLVEDEYDDTYDTDGGRTTATTSRPVPSAMDAPRPSPRPDVVNRPVVTPAAPLTTPVAERPAPSVARATATATIAPGADAYRISTLHPRSYNDARRIGEEYREGSPVIINLTGMDDSDAKRIVDFSAGLVFGLRGSIERMTNKVFLLSPANVDVGAEARAQIAQDGFFSQS